MEVLSSRVLLRPADFERSAGFYRDTLGLGVYREWRGGIVFFLGGGFLELSGRGGPASDDKVSLWLQVPDLQAVHADLAAKGVDIVGPPERKAWGLDEMWIRDPDGVSIVVVQVPEDHPLRRRP